MSKGRKFRTEHEVEDGWSRWVQPVMTNYKMACCDCGLVHEMQFKALRKLEDIGRSAWTAKPLDQDKYRVEFRARRNNRSTALMRRYKKRRVPVSQQES